MERDETTVRRGPALAGLIVGPVAFLLVLVLPSPPGLPVVAWRATAVLALVLVWWLTEAVPLGVAALVPLVFLPLVGAGRIEQVASPYADPIIFLFLGGFLLALAVARHGLDRRLAAAVLRRTGPSPARIVGGVMLATAFLSMWISNTATAAMMLPVGLALASLVPRERGGAAFAASLLLGIAVAASLGGMTTLVGTPPNALLAGYLRTAHGIDVSFAAWMLVALPVAVIALPVAWLLVTRVVVRVPSGDVTDLAATLESALGPRRPWSGAEVRVALVFAAVAAAWIARPLVAAAVPGASDASIAVAGALFLFVLPAGGGARLLDWAAARDLPWGVLLLFGGGLTLAAAMDRTGLAAWLAGSPAAIGGLPPVIVLLAVALLVVGMSEVLSNTATAALLLPLSAPLAIAAGLGPVPAAAVVALAASGGLALPVATPPNAIVYGTGLVPHGRMLRTGIVLDVLVAVLAVATALLIAPRVL